MLPQERAKSGQHCGALRAATLGSSLRFVSPALANSIIAHYRPEQRLTLCWWVFFCFFFYFSAAFSLAILIEKPLLIWERETEMATASGRGLFIKSQPRPQWLSLIVDNDYLGRWPQWQSSGERERARQQKKKTEHKARGNESRGRGEEAEVEEDADAERSRCKMQFQFPTTGDK